MDKQLNIGLFGFGVVGEGIYQVLGTASGLNAKVSRICVRHGHKQRNAPQELFTLDGRELLDDPGINTIVELIDHAEDAYAIVKSALQNGKSVVSANKKMIAEHLPELLTLAAEKQVSFLYEAAVCGSIPLIRNLEEYYDNNLLNSFCGIVNGSTNYILTRINEARLSYDEALKEAQHLGFAESDPSLDVEGYDAANKLCIILKHAYGLSVLPEQIFRAGITALGDAEAAYARSHQRSIRLVARAYLEEDGSISAWVLPEFVKAEHPLYAVRNEFNGVLLGSRLADAQFLYGKGAGRYPTASAVLSDISALRYNYRYEYRKSGQAKARGLNAGRYLRVYLRSKSGPPDLSVFSLLEEEHRSTRAHYATGIVKLEDLSRLQEGGDYSVVVIDPELGEEELLFEKAA